MTGFRCKAFQVAHDRCGMKVNTDSIVLGAWVNVAGIKRCLDIGTGSGILSLMLAQRLAETASEFSVTGVEIEPEAASQAAENFANSPWHASLDADCADICSWQPEKPFDLIISNPPYFGAGQQLECSKRQQARLEDALSFEQLMSRASALAHPQSRLAVIIPAAREEALVLAGQAEGWFLSRRLGIEGKAGKGEGRVALEFGRQRQVPELERLTIRDGENLYTEPFKALTKAFYLAF